MFTTLAVLGVIQGQSLIMAVIGLIILGLIVGLLWWLIDYVGLPEPINKIARVVIAIFVVLILINFLLSIIGQPLIVW